MTPEETITFVTKQLESLNDKIDNLITPVKESVVNVKAIVDSHTIDIIDLRIKNEGHQQFHKTESENRKERRKDRRFYWEILLGSGGIMGILVYFLK